MIPQLPPRCRCSRISRVDWPNPSTSRTVHSSTNSPTTSPTASGNRNLKQGMSPDMFDALVQDRHHHRDSRRSRAVRRNVPVRAQSKIQNPKSKIRPRGFTLVELLVVMTILLILTGL